MRQDCRTDPAVMTARAAVYAAALALAAAEADPLDAHGHGEAAALNHFDDRLAAYVTAVVSVEMTGVGR